MVKPFHIKIVGNDKNKQERRKKGKTTMRKKLKITEKRSKIIGIKTDITTKKKIEFIAKREGEQTSTYLYNLISKHIEEYGKIAKINWETDIKEVEEWNY